MKPELITPVDLIAFNKHWVEKDVYDKCLKENEIMREALLDIAGIDLQTRKLVEERYSDADRKTLLETIFTDVNTARTTLNKLAGL